VVGGKDQVTPTSSIMQLKLAVLACPLWREQASTRRRRKRLQIIATANASGSYTTYRLKPVTTGIYADAK
jgi:hypothetical protein